MSNRSIPSLSYHAMRMRWCRIALLEFLKRWGVYLVVLAAVIGGGATDGALDSIAAAATWLVLPLLRAATDARWWLPAVLAQALAGALLLWGMRPLLWPRRWAEAERALPLQALDTARSDAVVVLLGLMPLLLLYGAGAANVFAHHPAWLRPARGLALAALLSASAGSALLGVWGLQALRGRNPGQRRPVTALRFAETARSAGAPARHWLHALLWTPLWRGPARRTGHAWMLGSLAACLPALGMACRPDATGWWLAAFAVLSLAATSRVHTLACHELAGLWAACQPLPLRIRTLNRARGLLAWSALLPGGLLLLPALPWPGLRLPVLAAYGLVCAGHCALQVASRSTDLTIDPTTTASRWLFGLVLTIALGTEVLK